MPFIKTNITNLIIFEPEVFEDERGYFFESYNQKLFSKNGIDSTFVQDNHSFSTYGTIRGLHFQTGDSAQAKLVRAVSGEILDVAVDLRKDSKTFGKHFSVNLSSENRKQLFIPRGFAHGFSVLSQTATVAYKADNFYNKKCESGIVYDDLDLDIEWQIEGDEVIVSKKDLYLKTFKDITNE